jgi:5'-methylthioadenosine phosphorylase
MIGFIMGSGSEELEGKIKNIETPWGEIEVMVGEKVAIVSRHGDEHQRLPHHINYRAIIWALKEVGVKAIVSFTVVGVLNKELKLGEPYIVEDLYFPENRLPNGEACSFFDKTGMEGRGHLIAGSLFNSALNEAIGQEQKVTYVHSIGPRFNTKCEISGFRNAGGDVISQTCGPEAVLANEVEIPYATLAFAIDYANGVSETPTGMDELNANLAKSSEVFQSVIAKLSDYDLSAVKFENFVYRF